MGMINLQTERLIIREPHIDDFANWHRLLSDGYNMRFLLDIMTHNENQSLENLQFAISESEKLDRQNYFLVMQERAASAFVGSVGFHIIGKGEAHMGYFILPEFHGKGYTTEAVKAIVKYAFDIVGLDRIQTGADIANLASFRVMEKSGFTKYDQSPERIEYHITRKSQEE
jgi:ribosomal-protein-alanine N-acetyltransferase